MTLPNLDPIPQYEPAVDVKTAYLSAIWFRWFSEIVTRLLSVPVRTGNAVHRITMSASIIASTLFTPSQPGDYVVRWFAQVTTAATTSSSLAVTIGWTSNGVACTKTFTALTGNTTATADGDMVAIRPDAGVAVTYAVAYASVGATAMQYMVDVWAVQDV